jgi:hypothetical protein
LSAPQANDTRADEVNLFGNPVARGCQRQRNFVEIQDFSAKGTVRLCIGVEITLTSAASTSAIQFQKR